MASGQNTRLGPFEGGWVTFVVILVQYEASFRMDKMLDRLGSISIQFNSTRATRTPHGNSPCVRSQEPPRKREFHSGL